MEFETLNTGRAPARTRRYTVARDTRNLAATSRTVSNAPGTPRTTNAPNGVASGGSGASVCDPAPPATPGIRRQVTRYHAVRIGIRPFGTKGSQVQILSPRPSNASEFLAKAGVPGRLPIPGNMHSAPRMHQTIAGSPVAAGPSPFGNPLGHWVSYVVSMDRTYDNICRSQGVWGPRKRRYCKGLACRLETSTRWRGISATAGEIAEMVTQARTSAAGNSKPASDQRP
jgi:hypothetical protein